MIDRPTQQQQSADHLAAQRATNRLAAELAAARAALGIIRWEHNRTTCSSVCPICRAFATYDEAVTVTERHANGRAAPATSADTPEPGASP